MANTLLVATDLSKNSKAAVRFAVQLARQGKQSLVFFHCLPYLRPVRWTDAQYERYAKEERDKAMTALRRFIGDIVRSGGARNLKFRCIVKQDPDAAKAIVKEAQRIGAMAICVSTRGAGRVRKLLGTHSATLVKTSPEPVFVIPFNYRRSPVRHIVYASDLNDLATELKQVDKVAKPLKAKVTVLHYDYLADVPAATRKFEQLVKRHKRSKVEFRLKKYHIDKSLEHHLRQDVKSLKASMAILFTNRKRGWFDKLFLSSKSVGLTRHPTIPLLIFPKA